MLRLDDVGIAFDGASCGLSEGNSICRYTFPNPGLDWADGDMVQARLARGNPEVSVAAVNGPVTEGSPAQFRVTANAVPTTALTVNLNITADGGGNGDYGVTTDAQTVIIEAGNTSATHDVATTGDDVDETNGPVTATLAAPASDAGYTVSTTPVENTATVTVANNDTRGVTVSANQVSVSEGGTGTYTVRLNTQPTGGNEAVATDLPRQASCSCRPTGARRRRSPSPALARQPTAG